MKNNIERIIAALKPNGITGMLMEEKTALPGWLDGYVKPGWSVGMGGSMTLFETGVVDYLRGRKDICLLDRFKDGLGKAERGRIQQEALACDLFLTSANAITSDGKLMLVDGTGSRVGPVCYGPKKVLVIVGANKIVTDSGEGFKRVRETAGPANCRRLSWKTQCLESGICDENNCHAPASICNEYVVIRGQVDPERMTVVIINGNYGY